MIEAYQLVLGDWEPLPVLVMDYCNGNSLLEISKLRHYSLAEVRKISIKIINCLIQLKKDKFVHRDFNYKNVFIHFPELEGIEDLVELKLQVH